MPKRKKIEPKEPRGMRALMGAFIPEDVHLYRINRPTFTIYVGGDVNSLLALEELPEPGVEYNMADRFELNLGILSGINPRRPILVQMASCGGNWEEGMQMFGAILTCPNPVTVLATKWARSMTSIIPLAADRFVLRPPAKYMYHQGTYGFSGLEQEADTDDLERRKIMETMLHIYMARLHEQGMFIGRSEEKIRAVLEQGIREKIDVWFTADEAKRWGFVDDVFLGDFNTLRAKKRNEARRACMLEVLRRPIQVHIEVS